MVLWKLQKIISGLIIIVLLLSSCSFSSHFHEDFNEINDRVWVSPELWSIPIENWKVNDGRLECTGTRKNMRVVLLSYQLQDHGKFLINLKMGLLNKGNTTGSGGIVIGLSDETDSDIRSLAYFGTGLKAGVNTENQIFLGEISKALPEEFDLSDFMLYIDGYYEDDNFTVRVEAIDQKGVSSEKISKENIESLEGAIALVNNHPGGRDYKGNNQFWFDEFHVSGSSLIENRKDTFGPILWSMYTLNKGKMKMSVQMPPLGEDDNKEIELHLKNDGNWELAATEKIEARSRTAIFLIDNWDHSTIQPYKIVYRETSRLGIDKEHIRIGEIKEEPLDRPLVMGGLTCQYNYGFPYSPLVNSLNKLNPDILYFSGDQIYEGNGGYGIIRFPADSATLNYLGKWYLFGWAFGDLMKSRPTITIPDDHDVFQGNLWGDGGKNIPFEIFRKFSGTSGGYVEPHEMVNAVHRTQCGHLPDCYDPATMEQGINPYYTEVQYGGVSFAITGDRMFKSGPREVAYWEGRKDHIKEWGFNQKKIDPPGLKLIGDRQSEFLKNWASSWNGEQMKCLLSQTIFTNIATHHGGNKMILAADLDSGGWPIGPRNNLIDILRSCFAFHIAGDQHLPTLVQYGIDDFRDAGWAFCTPAIAVGYQRRFQPIKLDLKIENPPGHSLPNTGEYTDPFGHPSYIHAVGNPADDTRSPNRYERAQLCSSGFGIIRFDQDKRTISAEAYKFLPNPKNENELPDQFPGWPHTIMQTDNNGREIKAYLPEIELNPEHEFVQIVTSKTGELVYSFQPAESTFTPWVYDKGLYNIRIINTESGEIKEVNDVKSK